MTRDTDVEVAKITDEGESLVTAGEIEA
jgi:hypothetical protein